MGRKTLFVWIVVYIFLLICVVVWGSQSAVMCWDGYDVDEEMLMDLCGITKEYYFSEDYHFEDCPEAEDALTMVGGCETDWPSVLIFAGGFSLFYFVISGLIYGVRRMLIRVE